MLDVQNFFQRVLAVVIAKLQYLHIRKKLSVNSIEYYRFPVVCPMYAEVMSI